jgi:hypothetical protein
MSAAAGAALSGKKVVVYYTVEGGSFNAYSPHLSMAGEPNPKGYLPGNLKRINDLALQGSAGKCAAGSAATTNVILNGGAYDIGRYNSCDLVTKTFTTSLKGDASGLPGQSYPDRGFSDTEYLINKQNLDIVRVLGTLGGEVATNVGQVFGVAVSYPLYYQFQKNDIATGDIAASCTAAPFSATAPNLTPACQPSVTAQAYSTAAGRDGIGSVDGALFGGATGSVVNLARRVPTSGAQSASNIRFLGKPCAMGLSQGMLEPARPVDSTATAVVTEQSSTEGVKSVLNTATGTGQFALGVISWKIPHRPPPAPTPGPLSSWRTSLPIPTPSSAPRQ